MIGHYKSTSNQLGFTLIEVLITVVILSIGLLGVASLQYMSKRSGLEATQRTAASMLAYDLIERMRANSKNLSGYAKDADTPTIILGANAPLPQPKLACNDQTAACDKYSLAELDLWQWEQMLSGAAERLSTGASAGGLVLPTACISTTVPAGPANRSGQYTVAIAWRGSSALADPYASTATGPYTCGRGTGLYDSESGATDVHRRILVIESYISEY